MYSTRETGCCGYTTATADANEATEGRRNRSGCCCLNIIAGILFALLALAVGVIVGAALSATVLAALPAFIVFAVIILVLLVLLLIYRRCKCYRS